MAAKLLYFSKITILHKKFERIAIIEMKVWEIGCSKQYPQGIKYSLFCVDKTTKELIIGFDNHHPKGHHKHLGEEELIFEFKDIDALLDEFLEEVAKRGYEI